MNAVLVIVVLSFVFTFHALSVALIFNVVMVNLFNLVPLTVGQICAYTAIDLVIGTAFNFFCKALGATK